MSSARPRRLVAQTRWWHAARLFAGLGLAALALWALNGRRSELVDASGELARLVIPWLLLAIASEIASLVCFAELQRRLLNSGGVRVPLSFMTSLTFAAGAISNSLPAGPAFASVYAFGVYRRRGANDTLAAWTLLATFACAAAGLGLIATAGVILATRESASYDLIGVILGVFAISIAVDAVVFQRRWLEHVAIWALDVLRRIVGRPRRSSAAVVQGWLLRLEEVDLSRRDLVAMLAAAFGNWAFDCGCLACAFLATGGSVPWRGLLLAYGAGQLAANLPITPGGLGVVEGSLTVALVAFGGAELSTVAAVLVYRIVSFWGFLPIGWLSWAGLGYLRRRNERSGLTKDVESAVASERVEARQSAVAEEGRR
ncbi:MAG: lysylphosphatidylglycerol synthase transmembrane domain-containing protein [Acidimicrobiales bacterium]